MSRTYRLGKGKFTVVRVPGKPVKITTDTPGNCSTVVKCDYCERETVVPDDGVTGKGTTCPDGWRILELLGDFYFLSTTLVTHQKTRDMCPECVREEGLRDE
jgi:hypothetical protein